MTLKHSICGKEISIVDDHQDVLPIWAEYFLRTEEKPELVTFDYHADSMEAFRFYAGKLESKGEGSYEDCRKRVLDNIRSDMSLDNIKKYTKYLLCDEQIKAAYDLGIISSYQILYCLHNHEGLEGHLKARLLSLDCTKSHIQKSCLKDCLKEDFENCNRKLDDFYIESAGLAIPSGKFILDFDLDYFQMEYTLEPIYRKKISSFIKNAELITIARSQEYFDKIVIDSNLTNEKAEKKLLELIRGVLEK